MTQQQRNGEAAAANLTELFARRTEALFGLATGDQLTVCKHLTEVTGRQCPLG